MGTTWCTHTHLVVINNVCFNSSESCCLSLFLGSLSKNHKCFHTLLTTKSRQLQLELRCLTKGSLTIEEFILHIWQIQESLQLTGDPVPHRNLIGIALEVLPKDYNLVIAAVNSNNKPCTWWTWNFTCAWNEAWKEQEKSFSWWRGYNKSCSRSFSRTVYGFK